MKKKINKTSKHHIIPRSRKGSSSLENIAMTNKKLHQHYHALFSNRKPEEIINYLVKDYWKGRWEYVEKAYRRNNK